MFLTLSILGPSSKKVHILEKEITFNRAKFLIFGDFMDIRMNTPACTKNLNTHFLGFYSIDFP